LIILKLIILNVINALNDKDCVILAQKVVNTIKSVKNGKIVKTIDRETLYNAFTPQGFDYKIIFNLHLKAKKENKKFTEKKICGSKLKGGEIKCLLRKKK
jgi:2-C-methyl-D-erythritol 4-phosphate cytidylyltransferase